jgi:SAM-dependent methyltransferase
VQSNNFYKVLFLQISLNLGKKRAFMSLAEEYKNQASFRNWESYLNILPLAGDNLIFDFGCGIGTVSRLLAERVNQVIGIDCNAELLEEAIRTNSGRKIKYLHLDLNDPAELPMADRIWCSFTAAYFPDFGPVLQAWKKLLKRGGWLALVEMSGLYNHEPLNDATAKIFREYYSLQRQRNMYDFEMGTRLKKYLKDAEFLITHEEDKPDAELAFTGQATPDIIEAWERRFDRMYKFREHVGGSVFGQIRQEFIKCLQDKHHVSRTVVKYLVAQNTGC